MKVNLPFVKLPAAADTSRTTGTGKAQTTDTVQSGSGTAVELSSTARHLAQLSNPDQDVNLVRVSEIRDALERGTLKMNPERIADGLIASAQELLTRK